MKILFVTPFLPSPPRFGGQRRLDGLMRGLAQKHEVDVISFNRTDEWEHSSIEATRKYCREVVTLSNLDLVDTREKRTMQLRSLASLHSFEHLLAARRSDFQQGFDRLLAHNRYDVVQFEFVWMSAFRFDRRAASAPIFVLDEHNVEYDILKRTTGTASGVTRQVYNALNWRKLAREEHTAWRRFDGVTLTSRRDEELVQKDIPGTRTAVVPNGVDLTEFSVSVGSGEADSLLYFGAINYFPNQEAVIYFIDHIFPRIRQRRPRAKFRIVGPGAPESVLSRQGNGVEVVGMVDQVAPYIEQASAVVVPLRIGGGTRLKIVEALAKGKPVISTRLGAEGLDVVHDESLLLADDPEDFADQVERVLGDPDLAARLGARGRRLMEEQYSWQSIVLGLERFYDNISRTAGRRSTG
ncbi:MAG: glycosyltransferase family 4 protein [Pseudomonadota bacterium]